MADVETTAKVVAGLLGAAGRDLQAPGGDRVAEMLFLQAHEQICKLYGSDRQQLVPNLVKDGGAEIVRDLHNEIVGFTFGSGLFVRIDNCEKMHGF